MGNFIVTHLISERLQLFYLKNLIIGMMDADLVSIRDAMNVDQTPFVHPINWVW